MADESQLSTLVGETHVLRAKVRELEVLADEARFLIDGFQELLRWKDAELRTVMVVAETSDEIIGSWLSYRLERIIAGPPAGLEP